MANLRPLAVSVMPLETRRDTILHLATKADELNYHSCLLPETWSHDTPIILTEAALRTGQIHIGTGVMGVWGRSAAHIAMAAATLNAVSAGRFILGLGASTKQLTEGLHDIPYAAPYAKLRQTIGQVRALLAGQRIPLAVNTQARPLQLNLPPQPDIPIFLGASSPKSIRIAGELCDGWIPFLYPRDRLADGIAQFQEGIAQAENPQVPRLVCPSVPTVVSPDAATARKGAAWFVAFYLAMMGPIYQSTLSRLGFRQEVEAVLAANAGQKPAIVPPAAEPLLEQLTIYGTPEQARSQLDAWYAAGADLPGLVLGPQLSDAAIDFTLAAFRPG